MESVLKILDILLFLLTVSLVALIILVPILQTDTVDFPDNLSVYQFRDFYDEIYEYWETRLLSSR